MIIYSKSTGTNNGAIGKLETPIKMIIEHESDLLTKKGGICSWLFNVEKSGRFGETIIGQNEFDVFRAVPRARVRKTTALTKPTASLSSIFSS